MADEGVSQSPPPPEEIDITDEATQRAYASAGDGADDRAGAGADVESAQDDPRDEEPPIDDADGFGIDAPGGDGDAVLAGPPAGGATSSGTQGVGPVDDDLRDVPTPPLRKILESILLVVDEPVPEGQLAQVIEVPRAVVLETLEDLAESYERDGRGFELRQVAGGWRLYTAPDCAPYVERFVLDGQQARLTQAALETLAVIAYRQPVSRQSVSAIRGVNVDGVVRTLLSRGLIAESGEEGPGGAHLYVTTPYFLERLGLRSVDELPNLAPLLPVNIDDLADQA